MDESAARHADTPMHGFWPWPFLAGFLTSPDRTAGKRFAE